MVSIANVGAENPSMFSSFFMKNEREFSEVGSSLLNPATWTG